MKKLCLKYLRKSTYVHKYQSIDKQIEEIIRSLLIGRDNLQEDTVGLEMLKNNRTIKFMLLINKYT